MRKSIFFHSDWCIGVHDFVSPLPQCGFTRKWECLFINQLLHHPHKWLMMTQKYFYDLHASLTIFLDRHRFVWLINYFASWFFFSCVPGSIAVESWICRALCFPLWWCTFQIDSTNRFFLKFVLLLLTINFSVLQSTCIHISIFISIRQVLVPKGL